MLHPEPKNPNLKTKSENLIQKLWAKNPQLTLSIPGLALVFLMPYISLILGIVLVPIFVWGLFRLAPIQKSVDNIKFHPKQPQFVNTLIQKVAIPIGACVLIYGIFGISASAYSLAVSPPNKPSTEIVSNEKSNSSSQSEQVKNSVEEQNIQTQESSVISSQSTSSSQVSQESSQVSSQSSSQSQSVSSAQVASQKTSSKAVSSKKSSSKVVVPPTQSAVPAQGVVKKSVNNICHALGTRYYDQTKKFTPYNTLKECLDSGARLPLR